MRDNSTQPTGHRPPRPGAGTRRAVTLPLILLLCVLGTTVTGCGGCGGCSGKSSAQAKKKAAEEARKKKAEEQKKKRKKEPLEFGRLAVEPQDQTPFLAIKRGHWATASQRMKANLEDFVGNQELTLVDKNGRPLELDRTPYRMVFVRPVGLSKGRPKTIETTFFTPTPSPGNSQGTPSVATKLRRRGGSLVPKSQRLIAKLMPPYQYHFVVLAKNEARYTYIKTLDAVAMPNGGSDIVRGDPIFSSDNDEHYRVALPKVKKNVPLPENPLMWSTIAYVLWDDLEPDRLSLDQRQALVDWLHWGGQLIVSGPGSLDLLRGSFLDPYLPAENGGATKIEQAKLKNLSNNWRPEKTDRRDDSLKETQPWSGITLKLRPGTVKVPNTSGLVVEKRIGRGRIVVTAFRLDEPDFVNWKAIHGFYNACLLRRPHRQWTYGEFVQLNWADVPERRFDARLVTGLRFFSRDVGVRTNYKKASIEEEDVDSLVGQQFGGRNEPPTEEWIPPQDAPGGVAAWSDFSGTANAARESLRVAAGVTVPKAGFVLGVLAVYLVLLVPLNWMFFHAIGRVEWAWIAAPLIAVAGTMAVVWQAQLDIGFVRARTDVTIIETHGDFRRAHVTRFTALYTSLGTSYDIQSDNATSLIQPFPAEADYRLIEGQSRSNVFFRKHQDVQLTDYGVLSNSTNMVRSEQMIDLDGPIYLGTSSLGHEQIVNGSRWDLVDVAIVERPIDSKELKGCWVGRLKAGASSTIGIDLLSGKPPFAKERKKEAQTRSGETFPLDPLIRLALEPAAIEPGEVRMVGRFEGILPGMEIAPAASQVRGAALIVAHLKHGPLRKPVRDVNYRLDVEESNPDLDAAEGSELW